jgi:hypothetical protein
MTCAVVGDSIALMVAPFLGCAVVDAKVGEHVAQIVGRVHDTDIIVVSAGSNDADYSDLAANLEKLRAKCSHRVLWIVPALARPRRIVKEIALKHGDAAVMFAAGRDGVHPRDPAGLAAEIRSEFLPK